MEDPQQPVQLKKLKHGAKPPAVSRLWSGACWAVFVLGVLLVLGTLGAMALLPKEELSGMPGLKLGFLALLFLAFGLAAGNTFAAANGFRGRERQLEQWLESHLRKALLNPGTSGARFSEESVECGSLHIRCDSSAWAHPEHWVVLAQGDFQPEPYRRSGAIGQLRVQYREYIDLIHAEVTRARTRAGAMAAALGGVFVAALQVYGKVFT